MQWLKQRHYEQDDKSGKILAWQIRKEEATRLAIAIKPLDGSDVTHNTKHINQAFTEFYKSLYSSQGEKTHDMHYFLEGLDIPGLSEAAQLRLENKITKQEVLDALARLSGDKAPGPDGFSMDFFKTFAGKLHDLLLDMFNHAIESNQLSHTLEQALIIFLLKPGKDPNLCGSYTYIVDLFHFYHVNIRCLLKL